VAKWEYGLVSDSQAKFEKVPTEKENLKWESGVFLKQSA
jgi:hypothetical protein